MKVVYMLEGEDSAMMVLRTVAGGLLALALCCVSIACNYRFGTHLGSGALEGQIYGVLGGVTDALKALIPLSIAAAIASGHYGKVVAGTLLFIVFSVYSLASALGLYSLSREATLSGVQANKASYELIITEKERVTSRLKVLGETRSVGAVQGDINASMTNRRYRSTEGCNPTMITQAKSREFCDRFNRLNGELETAKEAQSLRDELKILNTKINGMDLSKVLAVGDPQSEALARLTGFKAEQIRTYLAVLVALLVELGSGLGLWVMSSGDHKHRARKSKPETQGSDVVAEFVRSKVIRKPSGEVSASDLYEAFLNWCKETNNKHVSITKFGSDIGGMDVKKVKRGGRIQYKNIIIA